MHTYQNEDGTPRQPTPFELAIGEVSKFKPADVLAPEDLERVRGGAVSYREPIDMVCEVCSAKHCHGHPQERGAGR
jgi:hypothetical protein